jgi:hypothetical protein
MRLLLDKKTLLIYNQSKSSVYVLFRYTIYLEAL